VFDLVRLALPLPFTRNFLVRVVSFLQVPPQVHKQGNGHTHYNQRTDTQDQEPPDHPHSGLG